MREFSVLSTGRAVWSGDSLAVYDRLAQPVAAGRRAGSGSRSFEQLTDHT